VSKTFLVRPAKPGDVPAIIELVKASWARTYDPVIGIKARKTKSTAKHVPDLFLGEIARKDAASIIALADTKIIGQVGGEIRGGSTFFIDHLHVESAWHGKGVAAALIEGLKESVLEMNCFRVAGFELTVLENNYRAIGFYKKTGFVAAKGDNEDGGLGGVASVLMRLELIK
jgi:ribosomal protein S18 acetylase RimI-like enzyme